MEHHMKLYQSPFERIKSGKKKVEIRLFDEKRQTLKLGDTIIFSKLPNQDENVSVEVIALLIYKSFHDLVNDLPITYFAHQDKQSLIESLYKIYSKEDEQKYGVLGIKICRIQELT